MSSFMLPDVLIGSTKTIHQLLGDAREWQWENYLIHETKIRNGGGKKALFVPARRECDGTIKVVRFSVYYARLERRGRAPVRSLGVTAYLHSRMSPGPSWVIRRTGLTWKMRYAFRSEQRRERARPWPRGPSNPLHRLFWKKGKKIRGEKEHSSDSVCAWKSNHCLSWLMMVASERLYPCARSNLRS